MLIRSPYVTAQEALHCASIFVDITEIEKCADLSAILGVSMPALRENASIGVQRQGVPHIEVDQLRPQPQS